MQPVSRKQRRYSPCRCDRWIIGLREFFREKEESKRNKKCIFSIYLLMIGLPWWLSGKESTGDMGSVPGMERSPGERNVFLPDKIHGHRSLAGYSPWGHKELDMTEWLSKHALIILLTATIWGHLINANCFICAPSFNFATIMWWRCLSPVISKQVWSQMGGFPDDSGGKVSTCKAGDPGSIPGLGRPLEKGRATHSRILGWRIPETEEPDGLQSIGSQSRTWLTD